MAFYLPWLQAFAQVPEGSVFYGPDTYMGGNLGTLLRQLATQSDEDVAKVHPGHTQASIRALLPRLHYFQVSLAGTVAGKGSALARAALKCSLSRKVLEGSRSLL